jgi:phosphoglycerate dehydrogenase-like enzyme
MSWNVLITASGMSRTGERAEATLRAAECRLIKPPRSGPFRAGELLPLLENADAVLASLDEYSAEVLGAPAARSLKLIARWGVGYDSIDVGAATRHGIVVTYTPGILDDAVADYTIALMLALPRRVCQANAAMSQGIWRVELAADVSGKTLGLIGCGRIGRAVARRAQGFNMRVLAFTPRPKPELKDLGISAVSLDQLLAESDFVSLHAALTADNHGMLGREQFRKVKPGAYLINTARGALIDENALVEALNEKRLAGAALDVYSKEPLPTDSALRPAPNILLSPHQASFTRESGERVSMAAANAILALLDRRVPENVLNPEVFDSPALRWQLKH